MRRTVSTCLIAMITLAFGAAAITSAEARKRGKKRHYGTHEARPLTVRKRSFLDNGKHPLPGAEHRYSTMFTNHGVQPYDYSGRYGSSVLPGGIGGFGPR
ncbi:MAG: hypothetical protein KDE63_12860 [Novosphingobium sp.]|nr:hypothetical protein [Novosphingobium sp.]MCC2098112.1 hypothetical protein [Hyphomicrobiales bacterium]